MVSPATEQTTLVRRYALMGAGCLLALVLLIANHTHPPGTHGSATGAAGVLPGPAGGLLPATPPLPPLPGAAGSVRQAGHAAGNAIDVADRAVNAAGTAVDAGTRAINAGSQTIDRFLSNPGSPHHDNSSTSSP